MDKLKLYQVSALGMLLLNLGLVAFIILSAPNRSAEPQRANERLALDEQQHEQFLQLAEAHRASMRNNTRRQRKILRNYFRELTQDRDDLPEVPEEILALEKQKIATTYQHLHDVKEILRPEQEQLYPDFVEAAIERIVLKKKKPLPRRKKE